MKRIYMTLAMAASLSTAAFAQNAKQADLGIKMLAPVGQQANLGASDTLRLSFEITNNGPDDIDATDTLQVMVSTKIIGTAVYQAYPIVYNLGTPALNIPAGGKDTLTWSLPNGSQFLNDGTPVSVPTDAKVCEKLAIYGYSANGYYINDDGFDASAFLQVLQNAQTAQELEGLWDAFSDNTVDEETVTFGSGATDLCTGSGTGIKALNNNAVGMNVYPNPANQNSVSLNFTLNKVTSTTGVQITDVAGRIVFSQDLGKLAQGEHFVRLDISALNAGLYFLHVNAEGERGVTKLTITK